jgi:hypothetical protein
MKMAGCSEDISGKALVQFININMWLFHWVEERSEPLGFTSKYAQRTATATKDSVFFSTLAISCSALVYA